jgi:hypothetical protein
MTLLISKLILALFALGAIALTAWVALAIAANFRTGREFRARLAQRLQGMRMHRMAKALGIDVEQCLHGENVVRIEQNMRRCEACDELEACDEKLAKGELSVEEIGFCPNRECLAEYARHGSRT